MSKTSLAVVLSEAEMIRLEQWIRAGSTPQPVVLRAPNIRWRWRPPRRQRARWGFGGKPPVVAPAGALAGHRLRVGDYGGSHEEGRECGRVFFGSIIRF